MLNVPLSPLEWHGVRTRDQALRSGSNPNYPETVPFESSSDLK